MTAAVNEHVEIVSEGSRRDVFWRSLFSADRILAYIDENANVMTSQ
jgi:hypothetical protein